MPSKELQDYRKLQARIAAQRDGGICAIHKFGNGIIVKAQDIHHMFGRGKSIEDPRENYTRLLSVCRECHPSPIIIPNEEKHYDLLWVWMNANKYPMDKDFIHPAKYAKYLLDILMNPEWLFYLEYYERTP